MRMTTLNQNDQPVHVNSLKVLDPEWPIKRSGIDFMSMSGDSFTAVCNRVAPIAVAQ
jgi:hypothetical protein